MDKAEYQAKLNELTSYVRDRDYESALMIVNEIDWKRVKSVRTLSMVADVYEANKLYDDAKRILQISLERSPASRTVLAQLTEVSLRLGEINDAERYYEQFNRVAGSDNAKYLLQYKLLKAKRAPLDAQIEVLKAYRELEYTEEWAYELASLYAKAGDEERCVAECDDMILWFGEGKYVLRALELKMKYEGLTPAQRKLYNEELARENAGMSSPLPVFERTASYEPVPEEIEPDEMKGRLRESFQEVFQGIRREPPREEEPVGKIDNTMSLDELHISELEPERPDTTVIETPESAETIVSIPDPKPVKETEKPEPEEEVKVWTDIGLRRRKTEEELAAEAVEKFDLDSLLKETAGSFSEEISSGDYEKTTDGDFLSSIPELESEDELEESLNARSTKSGLHVDSDLPADAEAEPDTEAADAAYPEDEAASWPEEEQSAADAEEILYTEPEEEADAPAGAEEAGDLQDEAEEAGLQGAAEEADRQEEDAEALESSQEEAPPVPEKRGVVKALSGLFGAMTNRAGRQSGADRGEPKAVENTELPEAEEQTEAAQPAEALGAAETAEAQTSEDSAETVEEFREWTAEETAEPEEAAADELPGQTQEESAGEEEIASWGVGDTAETRPSWLAGDSGEPDNEPQAWAIGDVEETAEDVQDEPRREGAAAGFAAGASGVLAGAAGLAAGAAGATAGAAGAVAGMTGSAAGTAAGAAGSAVGAAAGIAGSAVGAAAGAAGSAVGAAAGMAAGAAGLAAGEVSGGAETVNETAEPVKKYSAFAESIRKAVERQEAERKIRQAEEEKRRLKEELVAKAEAERHARDEAERLAREAEERRLQEEAERAARAEQERLAREEAERLAREAEERRLQEEAERAAREEAERTAREEAERQEREEAERQAREEAERQAREEAERQARDEADRQAREEAERQAREEAERTAREEAERTAREEAERQAREEAERQARDEAERQARDEAERQAREEAERQTLEEADESLTSNAPAEEIDENEAAALAEALAAYDERLKAEEEADKTLAASGEDVRRRSAEPEEIDEKEAAALAEAAAAQLAVEIAAELSADFGEPAADLLPDASAAEEVTDSAKALGEAGLEAPAEAAEDASAEAEKAMAESAPAETAEAPAEEAAEAAAESTAEEAAEAAAELPAEEAAEEAEISEPEMVEAPEQETLEAAGTSESGQAEISESEQAEISESEQVDVSESEQAEASESEQAEASESEQAEASDSEKENASPAAEADARKPRYNEELEVPDPEPTAKEKLSHSRTLDLSKVGENTVPVSLDEIISSETPEERRIRILHNEDQLRMNDEQRRIFTYFARIPGMDHQILSAMTAVYQHADEKTSSHGNLAIMGAQGSGKSKLAQNMISAMCLDLGMEAAKIARVTGYDMNKKDPAKIVDKMAGGFLIIEECSEMSSETVAKLGQAMDFRTDRMILIIEDEKAAMRGFLRQNPEFSKRIEKVISIPIFTNDELITFARTYAGENGYKLDDMAVLALYTIIGNNQSYESPMTISKVKTMVDEAITQSKHSPKRSRRGRRRGKDDGLLILQEKDFETT